MTTTATIRFLSTGLLALALSAGSAAELERHFPPIPADQQALIAKATPTKARVKPAKPRQLLVFTRSEGFVHSSIPYAAEALVNMGAVTKAFTAEVRDDMAVFTPAQLARYDGVIFVSSTQLKFSEPAQREALMAFFKQGRGLMGLHAASDNFPTWPEAQQLLGGVFHGHPWTAGDTVAVKLDEPTHPLVKCFHGQGFWIRDEIYQIMGDYSRDRQRVLMSLDMSKPQNQRTVERTDNDFPISWLKETPNGIRVFYSSLGHREDVFYIPEVMQHLLDGIQFALGDLKADAVPSGKLKIPPKPALAPDTVQALQDRPVH